MSKARATAVLAAGLLLLTGCASNAIVGNQLSRKDAWYGELGITGHVNRVTVRGDSRLTVLSVVGDANTIVLEDGATLGKVEIWGQNNTISIPWGLLVRQSIVGKGNQIIRRPVSWKAAEPASEPSPATPDHDAPPPGEP